MKRYLVFGGATYYPSGGAEDFEQDFDSLMIAKAYVYFLSESRWFDWTHIYDGKQKAIIFNFIKEKP